MTKANLRAITHSVGSSKRLVRGLPFAAAAALLLASSCTIESSKDCASGGEETIVRPKGGKTGAGGTTAATGGTVVAPTGGTIAAPTGGTTVVAAAGATVVATAGTTAVGSGGTTSAGATSVVTGGTTGVAGATFNVTPISAAAACAKKTIPLGLTMYILQDATGSMSSSTSSGESKWEAITAAVSAFVVDADSVGISGGLGFFSVENASGDTCLVANYTTPAVPVGSLKTTGPTIAAAIANQSLDGLTATPVALQGAITYARSVATQRAATDRVIVVLATDGMPNDCYNTNPVTETSDAAAAGLAGTPSIPTYVLGVVAASDTTSFNNLNAFALAGGTGTAFVVDTAGTGNRSTRALFGNAMSQIRDANLVSCDLTLPPTAAGYVINSSQASLEYTAGATTASIPWRADYTKCDPLTGGFFYDNNESPALVKLCPASCTAMQTGASATLSMNFACKVGQATGAGGASGTGGATNRGPVCLLPGQSCTSSASCCSQICSGAICG